MNKIKKILCISVVSCLLTVPVAYKAESKQKRGHSGSLEVAVADDNIKVANEQDLVSHLENQMTCKKTGGDERSFYCNLKFRGLEMDFAGVNAPLSRTKSEINGMIYILSLGKDQILHSLGSRCQVVRFSDPDLLVTGHGDHTDIVFRNDGNISYLYKNAKTKNSCEQ
jgi:hypothetical protein